MIAAALAWFMSKAALPLAVMAAVGLAISLTVASVQLKAAQIEIRYVHDQIDNPKTGFKAQVRSCNADFDHEKGQVKGLTSKLAEQTAEVVRLGEEGRKRELQAAEDLAASRKSYERRGEAAAIMALKPTGDTCQAAFDLAIGAK